MICYTCGQRGHISRNCPRGGARGRSSGGRGSFGAGRQQGRGSQWANMLAESGVEVTEDLYNVLNLGSAAALNQEAQRQRHLHHITGADYPAPPGDEE